MNKQQDLEFTRRHALLLITTKAMVSHLSEAEEFVMEGLALGVSRTWRDTLMEKLTGFREEAEPFLLTTEEPIEKASIKSRLLSNLVA